MSFKEIEIIYTVKRTVQIKNHTFQNLNRQRKEYN